MTKVVFTKASTSDTGFTVTADRLNSAGFSRVDSSSLLKGERYTVTLTDVRGRSVTTTLTVNRAKANGSTQTTLYTTSLAGKGLVNEPEVGSPVTYLVTNLKKLRNRG
jgi:hypothetical protein